MEDIYITDLLTVGQLQKFQNSFSRLTGLAALTTDAAGKPVTEGSNFTRYCMEYTRESKVGCERCHKCDIEGAKTTLKTGRQTTYVCHSGLIDFAAPIMVDDNLVGSFIGGQVLTNKPDMDTVRKIAEEIDVPFEEYWAAINEVPVMSKKQIDEAAEFLYETAGIISDIAYSKYRALENQKETERVSNMKTDFLANMSHEIRTPMNAVIGMAEMALREDLPDAARDYIGQIKSSGNALLAIINDILDFSKIESGKMDIICEDYDPLSVTHDLSGILMTRLHDKDVELIGTLNPDTPIGINGDILRIRQIVINIANNAIKFTKHGYVWIDVDFEKKSEDEANFIISVTDTGIGIKKEDIGKLFESFQQLDSKRNRGIEGTGLGLAITARLLGLMNGTIRVSSVYGKGSTFTIKIPQKITDWTPAISVNNKENKVVIGYWKGVKETRFFYESVARLGVDSYALITLDRMSDLTEMYEEELKGKEVYLFTTIKNYEEDMQAFVKAYPDITFIVTCDFYSKVEGSHPNVRFVKKPYSNLAIANSLNNETLQGKQENTFELDFIAPDAKVLVVDDNDVNLVVTEGLLEPLKMKVTKANSGQKALTYIEHETFDIVFMDHMMPELDGVEVTRIIRRLHPELNDMPIIALTANAVGEAKKMFLEEGMNDFVAKPIELRTLVSKIRQWLPKEKIINGHDAAAFISHDEEKEKNPFEEIYAIGDLDIHAALQMIGSKKLYFTILEKYYNAIESKARLIKTLEESDEIEAYTIEVHALKSSSRQIGATALADMAAELEECGHIGNLDVIHAKTNDLIFKYIEYADVLRPLFAVKNDSDSVKSEIDKNALETLLDRITEAAGELDVDTMETAISELEKYKFSNEQSKYLKILKEAVENYDVDTCESVITEWRGLL